MRGFQSGEGSTPLEPVGWEAQHNLFPCDLGTAWPGFLPGQDSIPENLTQWVKHLPTMRETQVQSLSRKDPLEKEMAVNFSILTWEIPWTEEPGGLQSMGSQESDTT